MGVWATGGEGKGGLEHVHGVGRQSGKAKGAEQRTAPVGDLHAMKRPRATPSLSSKQDNPVCTGGLVPWQKRPLQQVPRCAPCLAMQRLRREQQVPLV